MARSKRRLRAIEVIFLGGATAMVVFLLLPAIDALRSPHRNVHCLNNLKQLGLAAQTFHSHRNRLPGYVQSYGAWRPGQHSPAGNTPEADQMSAHTHEKVGTWVVSLLPYLDQQALLLSVNWTL